MLAQNHVGIDRPTDHAPIVYWQEHTFHQRADKTWRVELMALIGIHVTATTTNVSAQMCGIFPSTRYC